MEQLREERPDTAAQGVARQDNLVAPAEMIASGRHEDAFPKQTTGSVYKGAQ